MGNICSCFYCFNYKENTSSDIVFNPTDAQKIKNIYQKTKDDIADCNCYRCDAYDNIDRLLNYADINLRIMIFNKNVYNPHNLYITFKGNTQSGKCQIKIITSKKALM